MNSTANKVVEKTENTEKTEKTGKKTKTAKCEVCRTKLIIMAYTCRCEKQYCISHLPAVEHACPFNYKGYANKELKAQLDTTGLVHKIDKI